MTEFRFRLLGPVRAWRGETELEVGPPQQQAVLAVLLLSRGAHVSMASMLDALWGERPPKSGAGAVRTYVSRLRQILNAGDPDAGIVIEPIGDGYALRGDRVSVDVDVFERRVGAAVAARGAGSEAADLCRQALTEWRGVPLVGVPGPYFEPVRARMIELRADAAETEAAAQVEAGDHLAAIASLRRLITSYPLRESLHELLMLALYRAGRQADSLDVYESARRILRDELGIEPGPALKRMQQRVLSADDALAPIAEGAAGRADRLDALGRKLMKAGGADARIVTARGTVRTSSGTALAVRGAGDATTAGMIGIPSQRREPRSAARQHAPRAAHPTRSLAQQLQAARRRAFVGRESEIAAFRTALDDAARPFTFLFVSGPGGIGKTSLLRRFADEAADAGRLVVELDPARGGERTPAVLEAAASRMLADEAGAVLLLDAFEHYQHLETWLREDLLPRLPLGSVVVFAGRTRPARAWRSDPAWQGILELVELAELPERDARTLLGARRVPEARHEPVLAFAGGNPLALSLIADAARRNEAGDDDANWTPPQDVIGTLVDQFVGDAPSAEHRRTLDVCALLPTTNEELLRAALPDADTAALFAWLRELPFIASGPRGVYPHDVVRAILDADLKWRDPERHQLLRARVMDHVADAGPAASTAPTAVIQREDFNAAVRSALRAWHRPDALGGNLLRRTGFVSLSPDDNVVPADRIRAAITEALRRLREDRHGEKQYLVIAATYLDADAKQQQTVADELELPFGTYRRHLAQGLDRLCELLWHGQPAGSAKD
ncbi:BTAD domain-containing putative transcriptional regulator [Actinospica sp.]|uniref:BTAD domain-containing putative transcriptional regulator n=1 Tax=Actinospica sp. TaxID=1872142 RepID=UPI002C70C6B3|nr:BTAD domain-containing putative transcriptional regulator [Actinospica sp.]HWG22959.1 BTAD domain-containing putative transcriptional regulator [Actinospica sp.]